MSENTYPILKVTSVQVYPVKKRTTKIKAMARVILSDQLQLTGLRLVEGSNGDFVGYPNDNNTKAEEYKDIYFPVNSELREAIEAAVIEEFAKK
jgi:stage V sporulation protein G